MLKLEEIRKIIISEADQYDWKFHIEPVINNALILAAKLNADQEVVEAAALLHDIGRLRFGPKKHGLTGAPEAQKILIGLNYDADFIDKVVSCVKTHGARPDNLPETLEARIIANADAMAHFDVMPYFFYLRATDSTIEEAFDWVTRKFDKDWNQKLTLEEAREIVKDKHSSISLLLNSLKKIL